MTCFGGSLLCLPTAPEWPQKHGTQRLCAKLSASLVPTIPLYPGPWQSPPQVVQASAATLRGVKLQFFESGQLLEVDETRIGDLCTGKHQLLQARQISKIGQAGVADI